jgi:predicted TIM-barrel fold metal-dependent hydrolase
MRYFDCHVHLASSDQTGFDRFVAYVGSRSGLVGCNLVLNTREEVSVVSARVNDLPSKAVVIPPLALEFDVPDSLKASRWCKIHPSLHRVTRQRIREVLRIVDSAGVAGVMIHHFPWGDDLEHNTGLELVIEVARAFPQIPVVATHGGGYESWQLRAHTARLRNVYYDFSVTFAVYEGTDHLRPWVQYVQRRKDRLLFGSDWPSAEAEPQLQTAACLAKEGGLGEDALESQLLENSSRLWSSRPNFEQDL